MVFKAPSTLADVDELAADVELDACDAGVA
jgi:hypothetical protein